jgi:hypothetical protein
MRAAPRLSPASVKGSPFQHPGLIAMQSVRSHATSTKSGAKQKGGRSYVTGSNITRADALAKLEAFQSKVTSAAWIDCYTLSTNMPVWEEEMGDLSAAVRPYLHEAEVCSKFAEAQETMDQLHICEDVMRRM